MTDGAARPVTVLLSAIGGEGGGVLATWIVAAARNAGLPVQSTSIPGVAQRTGATTYYIEVFPVPIAALGGRRPVLSLYPCVGDVDVMLASEFAEAGRAAARGFITPDRTLLIASTHRVYAIDERSHMADGRFDSEALLATLRQRARRALLGDFRALAETEGVSVNAALLGALAGSGVLPIPRAAFEEAVREGGIAVAANLRGFEAGLAFELMDAPDVRPPDARVKRRARGGDDDALARRLGEELPPAAQEIATEGVRRLIGYQDAAYAALYLDRLKPVAEAEKAAGGDGALVRACARQLAVRMSYEDVIRVAQLKSAPGRYARVRAEIRAAADEPVIVRDYFKPGVDELASILPPMLARRLLALAESCGWRQRVHLGMRVNATSVSGYLRLRLLAGLRRWRRGTWRYAEEARAIETWLSDVVAASRVALPLALEVVECAGMIKGYGDTSRRGASNAARIREAVIAPALSGAIDPARAADALANARAAALTDETGARLDAVLAVVGTGETASFQAAE